MTALPYDRPLRDDEYPEEDERPSQRPDLDPLSAVVGARGFKDRHVVDECVERFPESGTQITRFPERFDRFYWEPAPLLVDLVQDGTPEQLEEDRLRKRVAFKTDWCLENDRRYVVIPISALDDPQRLRALLASTPAPAPDPSPPAGKPGAATRTRRRGTIQRPKATAA